MSLININDLNTILNNYTMSSVYSENSIPPLAPMVGDEWLDLTSGILFKYLSDGTSSYWVDISGTGATLPVKVIQVRSAIKTNPETMTGLGYFDITGLSITFTPVSDNSIIRIRGIVSKGATNTAFSNLLVLENSTILQRGDSSGIRDRVNSNSYSGDVDNQNHFIPTSFYAEVVNNNFTPRTYKVQIGQNTLVSSTHYVNRNQRFDDAIYDFVSTSYIIVEEMQS